VLTLRLERVPLGVDSRVWLLALGKAALPMTAAAVGLLTRRGLRPAGGLVVGPEPAAAPHPALQYICGDHPEPGPGSFAAAAALERTTALIRPDDEVWILLSGGTSSLIAAPESELSPDDLGLVFRLLLGSGLDIAAMNRIRKRFTRWGGGKLAKALEPARVRVYVVSDVVGDDLASIGSGPCVPDPATALEVHALLEQAGLWRRMPESARALLLAVETGARPETPKAGDTAFDRVELELIASNRQALAAAASRARELGLAPLILDTPLTGEAAKVGTALAEALRGDCARQLGRNSGGVPPSCWIWGGETTVTLGERQPGLGGRCQELALAAARVLESAPERVALLAAGTDGRDGPTDAAGALVDGETWRAILRAGRDPLRDLLNHNAYPALDAAGALIRPGLSGTNVMDVVIGLCC
jgi:glycerate 2-kinase